MCNIKNCCFATNMSKNIVIAKNPENWLFMRYQALTKNRWNKSKKVNLKYWIFVLIVNKSYRHFFFYFISLLINLNNSVVFDLLWYSPHFCNVRLFYKKHRQTGALKIIFKAPKSNFQYKTQLFCNKNKSRKCSAPQKLWVYLRYQSA